MLGRYRGILILAAGFILMNLIGLDRSSVVWIDEVTLNDPAKELALHGTFRSSVFSGYDGFDETYLWQPPAFPLLTALVYKIFGFGIWQTRVPVVLFGAGAIIALYAIARRLFHDQRAALFASIFFAFNPQFIHAARSGRMDAQCLFLALLGITFYLNSLSGRRSRVYLVLSGVTVGLAGMTHPIAIVWAIAIAAMIVFSRGEGKTKSFLIFSISAAIPAIPWLLYALQTPETFSAQFTSHIREHLAQGSIFYRIVDAVSFYGRIYSTIPLVLISCVAGTVWFVWKYRENAVARLQLLILLGVSLLFVMMFMITAGGSGFYILLPLSMASMMVGAAFSNFYPPFLRRNGSLMEKFTFVFALFTMVNLVIGGIGGRYLSLVYQWEERDYATIEKPLLAHVPAGSRIFGAPEVWYASVRAGASLRVRGEPNPESDDFVVTKLKDSVASLRGFHQITLIGKPFPLVLGRYALSPADYQMILWEADRRARINP